MRAIIFFVFSLIFFNCIELAIGREFNVQCPNLNSKSAIFDASRLSDGSRIAIEKGDGGNPTILVFYHRTQTGCSRSIFARYSIEGGNPFVESLFFDRIDGKPNVFVIVSWQINNRGEGTYGKLYQVYAYNTNFDGALIVNPLISNDSHMTGIDGIEHGEQSYFQYKTAADVKKYLKNGQHHEFHKSKN